MSISLRAALALTLCLGAASACSSAADEADPAKVVSFRSGAAAAPSASPAGRPVMRIDMTRDEEDQLWNVYFKCLAENGVPMKKDAAGAYQFSTDDGKMRADKPEVRKACGDKVPQQPPEMDPEQNPYLKDDENNFWQCLKDHGDDVHKVADGWEPGPKWGEIPNAAAVTEACEVQAFDGKKG